MSESPSFKIRLLGGLAGCVVGAVLGVLIGMAFSKAIFAAVLGGCIGYLRLLVSARSGFYIWWPF
jgi:hypothetical protein